MNKKITSLFLVSMTFFSSLSFAQKIREIPKVVEETFARQYNGATNVEYRDQLVSVDVIFELNGEKMLAFYSNKGAWKGTEKKSEFDKLPEDVKVGFEKSKYGDREVEETAILYLPGGAEQYRVKAKKNDVEKKYLFFNESGRLLRTSLTL